MRIGYYYRHVLSLELGFILLVPIARYLCKKKRKPKLNDRTFSLLPDCLIPYVQPTIQTLMRVMETKILEEHPDREIVTMFYSVIYETRLNLSTGTLIHYYELFEQTAQKIRTFLRELEKDDRRIQVPHTSVDVYEYMEAFKSPQYGRGPESCDRWYYESLGGYKNNAYFLFGTASQFRY